MNYLPEATDAIQDTITRMNAFFVMVNEQRTVESQEPLLGANQFRQLSSQYPPGENQRSEAQRCAAKHKRDHDNIPQWPVLVEPREIERMQSVIQRSGGVFVAREGRFVQVCIRGLGYALSRRAQVSRLV